MTTETYYINVPQGRSARLVKDSLALKVSGLYTEEYSVCHIIICISEDKISLTHADFITRLYFDDIAKEINWVGKNGKVIIITRDGQNHHTKQLKSKLDKNNINYEIKEIENDVFLHHGIGVSFSENAENHLHPKICSLSVDDSETIKKLSHPDEHKFLTTRKLHQVFGLKSLAERTKLSADLRQERKTPKLNIFDGQHWETLEAWDLTLCLSENEKKEQLSHFNHHQTYGEISKKLKSIFPNTSGIVFLTPYLENYLNDYNEEFSIFKNNMIQIVKHYLENTSSAEADKLTRLKDDINASTTAHSISTALFAYELDLDDSEDKRSILDSSKIFNNQYQQRIQYNKNKNDLIKQDESITEMNSSTAIPLFRKGDFSGAKNVFLEVLRKSCLCYQKSNPKLASAYYNLGRCCQKLLQFQEANHYLTAALELRNNYIKPSPSNKAEIEKLQNVLKEIAQTSSAGYISSLKESNDSTIQSPTNGW